MLQTNEILGIIPARMASTRFPGKPLVLIQGVPMIIRVFRAAATTLPNLVIASGDPEIGNVAGEYGAGFVLTREEHSTGTSRCIEAMRIWSVMTGKRYAAILNIQGDEPMLSPSALALLVRDISRPETEISTLIRPETDPEAFRNPNRVKVVTDNNGFALYFSRSPIPYYRNSGTAWSSHAGLYAFKKEVLEKLARLEPGKLENAESLEQLRWLENGYRIHCCETDYAGFGVDTPADLDALLQAGLI